MHNHVVCGISFSFPPSCSAEWLYLLNISYFDDNNNNYYYYNSSKHPDVSLVGNSTHSQKGVSSLSCGRELRCDIVNPARIESWRESHNNSDNNNDNNRGDGGTCTCIAGRVQ